MKLDALEIIDFYKTSHREQYPEGTSLVYSNFTPRSGRLAPVLDSWDEKVVVFGIQYLCEYFLKEVFDESFFLREKAEVVEEYKSRMDTALGKDAVPVDHIEELWDLGFLPIEIRAIEEGNVIPMKVPVLTIKNTGSKYFWLVNYLETLISNVLWHPMTVATIAREYRRLLEKYADETGAAKEGIQFQAHDFSYRGVSNPFSAAASAGHLLYFVGTDTVPAIRFMERYYFADAEKELIGCSVPATEHSVMCMGGQDDEVETFRRLITDLYPNGIVSIVSDTWDFWRVVTEYVSTLKTEILMRDGKVVIRPDSGDPVKIVCGYARSEVVYLRHVELGNIEVPHCRITGNRLSEAEVKGAIKCLWDVFGGTVNDKGFKELDPHIGLIYGDSITLERAEAILEGLKAKGFASSNVVFGVGSFTYQHVTRDCFGFAMKATYGEVNGVGREIFKDPKTDSGTKKSAKGLLCVDLVDGEYVLKDQCTEEEAEGGELKVVYRNGDLINPVSLQTIRERVVESLK